MISYESKRKISKEISRVGTYGRVIDGDFYYSNALVGEKIPSFEELIKKTENLLNVHAKSFLRTSAKKANCVIRIYRHENLEVYNDTYWIYGVEVYWKELFGDMVSIDNVPIDYENMIIKTWAFHDESILLKPDFVDIYLKIK